MSIIAMRVAAAAPHPNADTLTVYTFEAPDRAPVQVVANQEHQYALGELAQVALVGTTLLDGTRIKRTRLRGVDSMGMAMGPTQAVLGADLSDGLAVAPLQDSDEGVLIKWTSIELLHHVRREMVTQAELAGEPVADVTYKAKVKLHGTNAGVQVHPDGRVVAQGRNRCLTLKDDNAGFARWVAGARQAFAASADPKTVLVFHGEWCGQGIQKGVSIARVPQKVFAIFAVQRGDHHAQASTLVVEPEAIAALAPKHPDVHVLPWYGQPLTLAFGDPEGLDAAVERLNARVDAVETNDPWVEATFGVKGTGEGLVLYPVLGEGPMDRDRCTQRMFKAKGEKHRVRKQRKAVELDPEVAQSIEHFVQLFVTEPRLEQALSETCPDGPTMRHTGAFLKWINADVVKEGSVDLEQAGLTWKQVGKAVGHAARAWFKDRVMTFG